jgi:tetratricopeptide (TPR) repeat protein
LLPEDSRAVVQAVLQTTQLPEALLQSIITRAAGNPFFLEELAWAVKEQRSSSDAIGLPDTIQSVLAARIDQLSLLEKPLLQTAAVIGTAVPIPLLQTIVELPAEAVARGLAHLQAAEFVYETRRFPEQVYTFKHALTQEVAYGSLLLERRRVLHARIVDAIEALASEQGAEQVERLAHHALLGEVWDKAVIYCQQAGARAFDRAAFHEAAAAFEHARQAVALLPEDGNTRRVALDIHLALANALSIRGEYGRALVLLGEAEALAHGLDDRAPWGRVLALLVGLRRITGDFDGAVAAGRQAIELAAALGDSALQADISYRLGKAYYNVGDFRRAAELLRWTVEATDRQLDTPGADMRILAQAWLAITLGPLGAFAEGRRHGEEALRGAMLAGRGNAPIDAHLCLGHLYLTQGELEHAMRVLEQGLALCHAAGNRIDLRPIVAGLGYAAALQGRLVEGRTLLEEAINESIRTGGLQGNASRLAWLSEVCRLGGGSAEAKQHARQALDLARQYKERAHEALALYQLGVVQTHTDPLDAMQAAAHYQQALALAKELGMRPLMAHCHLGLGRLYHQIGHAAAARATLATAINLYHAMDMTFWLPQAEAALGQLAAQ